MEGETCDVHAVTPTTDPQSQHSPNSHALFATDSLELKLAYTAINEHTNTHKRLIFRY